MFHGKVSFALSGLGLSKAKDPTETRSMVRKTITTGGGDKSRAASLAKLAMLLPSWRLAATKRMQ
jgi:hypothetical protein